MIYLPSLFFVKGIWIVGLAFLCGFFTMFFLNKKFIKCRKNIRYFSEFTMAFTIISSTLAVLASLSVTNEYRDLITQNVQIVGGMFILAFGLVIGNLFFFNKMDNYLQ